MGHRLSKITTRTGDKGETGLGDGTRVGKDHPRVAALGDIDELNSVLGMLASAELPAEVATTVAQIQNDLFDLGGELSIPGYRLLGAEQVARLEQQVTHYNATLPPLKEFILPGGAPAAALAHLARTVCRRAERALVSLARTDEISEEARVYLNRLSDLLFILGRVLNREVGREDVLWRKPATPGS